MKTTDWPLYFQFMAVYVLGLVSMALPRPWDYVISGSTGLLVCVWTLE